MYGVKETKGKRRDAQYFIDGVAVPKSTWECRKQWGEHPGAHFTVISESRESGSGDQGGRGDTRR